MIKNQVVQITQALQIAIIFIYSFENITQQPYYICGFVLSINAKSVYFDTYTHTVINFISYVILTQNRMFEYEYQKDSFMEL